MKLVPGTLTDIRERERLRGLDGEEAPKAPSYTKMSEPATIAMTLASDPRLPGMSLGQIGVAADALAERHWPEDITAPECSGPRRIASALTLLRDAARMGNGQTFAAYAAFSDQLWFPALVLCQDPTHQPICTILATSEPDLVARYAPSRFTAGMSDADLEALSDELFDRRYQLTEQSLIERTPEGEIIHRYDHLILEFPAADLAARVGQLWQMSPQAHGFVQHDATGQRPQSA